MNGTVGLLAQSSACGLLYSGSICSFLFHERKAVSYFFKDFSYAPMIENPFSDWFTEPAPLSKKLFALTALS